MNDVSTQTCTWDTLRGEGHEVDYSTEPATFLISLMES